MIKKTIIASLIGLALTVNSFAQSNPPESLFNANELSVSISSAYEFSRNYDFNFAGGVSYYILKYLGVDAEVPFYKSSGVSVDHVNFGLDARLPLFKHVAVVLGGGPTYNWHDDKWTGYFKGELEGRLNSKWGLFVGSMYQFDTLNHLDEGHFLLHGGIRLVF